MNTTGDHPRLSLCMIVRDSAATLPACLTGIRTCVDELVIVDTGSVDNTRDIARQFDARLFEFPWCDDFSAARNESLRHARGEWLFWMDADDTIDATNGRGLRDLARAEHPASILGFVVRVHCPGRGDNGGDDSTVVDHVKLIRNLPELRFEFRIHEQLLPSIRRLGGEVAWTDLFVTHSGSDQSPEGRARKYERDLRILGLELINRPDHPFALFNLGMTHADMGEHARAAEYLEHCLRASSPQETQVRKAYALLTQSYEQLGRVAEARAICERGLAVCEDDPELLFRRAKMAHDGKELALARDTYERLLHHEGSRHFTSIDRGMLGFKARHNLALVLQDLRESDQAELQWRLAIAEAPTFWPAWKRLGEQLITRRRYVTAEVLIAAMRERPGLALQAGLVAAELHRARSDVAAARTELQALHAGLPESDEPLAALCQLEFEHGSPDDALRRLQELATRQPLEGAVQYNLGVACFRVGDLSAARTALQRSLELRPDSIATRQLLEQVGKGLAKSWNEGILWGYERKADVVLVVNEDVEFQPGDVERLADSAYAQRDKFLVMGRCFHGHEEQWERSEYGCFAFNPPALQVLGCFDENFFPVYYEDSDFRQRARLAGLEPGYCPDVAIRHVGSASLQQPEVARQNTRTYAANRAYYQRKWGGDGGDETFERPFDDARFSYYIDPRVRTTPYPGFDRADQQLVTL